MAVGDIVNGIGTVAGADLSFQPAVGVTIMISAVGSNGSWFFLDNGTISSHIGYGASSTDYTGSNIKFLINNTNYITITPNGTKAGYTGIQIQ